MNTAANLTAGQTVTFLNALREQQEGKFVKTRKDGKRTQVRVQSGAMIWVDNEDLIMEVVRDNQEATPAQQPAPQAEPAAKKVVEVKVGTHFTGTSENLTGREWEVYSIAKGLLRARTVNEEEKGTVNFKTADFANDLKAGNITIMDTPEKKGKGATPKKEAAPAAAPAEAAEKQPTKKELKAKEREEKAAAKAKAQEDKAAAKQAAKDEKAAARAKANAEKPAKEKKEKGEPQFVKNAKLVIPHLVAGKSPVEVEKLTGVGKDQVLSIKLVASDYVAASTKDKEHMKDNARAKIVQAWVKGERDEEKIAKATGSKRSRVHKFTQIVEAIKEHIK